MNSAVDNDVGNALRKAKQQVGQTHVLLIKQMGQPRVSLIKQMGQPHVLLV